MDHLHSRRTLNVEIAADTAFFDINCSASCLLRQSCNGKSFCAGTAATCCLSGSVFLIYCVTTAVLGLGWRWYERACTSRQSGKDARVIITIDYGYLSVLMEAVMFLPSSMCSCLQLISFTWCLALPDPTRSEAPFGSLPVLLCL